MSLIKPPSISSSEIRELAKKYNRNKRETELRKNFKSDKVIGLLLKDDYTHIQILIFHYLDFIEQIKIPNVKKKKLLSIIFKTQGSENIRKSLSNVSPHKTEKNLEILQDLFTELGMEEPLNKVTKDLSKKRKS